MGVQSSTSFAQWTHWFIVTWSHPQYLGSDIVRVIRSIIVWPVTDLHLYQNLYYLSVEKVSFKIFVLRLKNGRWASRIPIYWRTRKYCNKFSSSCINIRNVTSSTHSPIWTLWRSIILIKQEEGRGRTHLFSSALRSTRSPNVIF